MTIRALDSIVRFPAFPVENDDELIKLLPNSPLIIVFPDFILTDPASPLPEVSVLIREPPFMSNSSVSIKTIPASPCSISLPNLEFLNISGLGFLAPGRVNPLPLPGFCEFNFFDLVTLPIFDNLLPVLLIEILSDLIPTTPASPSPLLIDIIEPPEPTDT